MAIDGMPEKFVKSEEVKEARRTLRNRMSQLNIRLRRVNGNANVRRRKKKKNKGTTASTESSENA